MISLFLDTASNELIVGLLKDDKLIDLKILPSQNDLSSKVLVNIDKIITENNIMLNELKKIYVVNGPGSFTGIRVGVTVAKMLAWSLKIDIYAVSELALIASTEVSEKHIVPVIDARRGFVYAAVYDNNLNVIIKDQYIKSDELFAKVDMKNAKIVSYDLFEGKTEPKINIEKIIKNKKFEKVDVHSLKPEYLKRTEAEEKNDSRN